MISYSDMEQIKYEIMNHEIISFDMFGTLVLRDLCDADDILSLVEQKLNINCFRVRRKWAERKVARKSPFYTLDEIYQCMSLDDAWREFCQKCEIDTEIERICCNMEIYDIYQFCKEQNKKMCVISDMYLSSNCEKQILTKCGYDFDNVFVSGEVKASKNLGSLFQYVINYYQCLPNQIYHIGDSFEADYTNARRVGMNSFFYSLNSQIYYNKPRPRFEHYLYNNLPIRMPLDKIVWSENNAFLVNRKNQIKNRTIQLGYEVLGPLIYLFCTKINDYCARKGIQKILFAARDTKLIMEVFRDMYPDKYDISYFRISRKALSPFEQLAVNPDADLNESAVWAFKQYLLNLGIGEDTLFVDSGWTGKTLLILNTFIKRFIDKDYRVTAAYIGIQRTKHDKYIDIKSFDGVTLLNKYLSKIHIYSNTSFIDAILSETGPSCVGYDSLGTPILSEERYSSDSMESIHKGVMKYIVDSSHTPNFAINEKIAICALKKFCENPTAEDINVLLDFKREDDQAICKRTINRGTDVFTDIYQGLSNSIWKGGYINFYFSGIRKVIKACYYFINSIRIRV